MREIKIVNMRENEMIKHSRNKMTKQAGRQNYIIFDANERKRNCALLEVLVPHLLAPTAVLPLFSISFVIYCPLSTIQEQCQKIEYMFLATKTLKMEIPECL